MQRAKGSLPLLSVLVVLVVLVVPVMLVVLVVLVMLVSNHRILDRRGTRLTVMTTEKMADQLSC